MNFSSVRDWCIRNDAPYKVVVPTKVGESYLPRTDKPGRSPSIGLVQPEIYVAEIRNATVAGGTGIFRAPDGTMLCDMACSQQADRYDLSPIANPWSMTGQASYIDEGVLLQSQYAANYFHWIVEHVARLLSLDDDDLPLLVDGRALYIPQLLHALTSATSRKIIPLIPANFHQVGRLVVPAPVTWIPPRLKDGLELAFDDCLISREAVQFLRETLGRPTRPTERIYIARHAVTAPVRLVNGDEVAETFASLGFTVVSPETMTFDEQRDLFGRAAVIAGESGSGLTNILWAPEDAILICLSISTQGNFFTDLANLAGQKALSVYGPITARRPEMPYQSMFRISPEQVREAVSWL